MRYDGVCAVGNQPIFRTNIYRFLKVEEQAKRQTLVKQATSRDVPC
jgi:hypothetical protein